MSDYAMDDSPPAQQHQQGSETPSHNISLDDPNAANNSIIGKVKSRVSSILPNRLSKWFSPSSKLQNDSQNGNVITTASVTRRRRRIEVEDDDENYDEDEDQRLEYEENHILASKQEENSEGEDEEEEDDESQNSEEEYNATLAAQKIRHTFHGRQPPAKRSRLNVDIRDSPLIAPRQPLIASTPSVGSTYLRSSMGVNTSATRASYQRFTNLNLYGNLGKKDAAYNFGQQKDIDSPKTNTDIIDLISTPSNEMTDKLFTQSNPYTRAGISSRRMLNIPSATSARIGAERAVASMTQLKRQPLSTSKPDLSICLASSSVPPRRTSTTIHEVKDSEEQSEQEDEILESNLPKYNGQILDETSNLYVRGRRQRHINGSGFNPPDVSEPNEAIILDTASESGESGTAYLAKSTLQKPQRKSGLFNTNISVVGSGTATTRNSSRTSSFGNGLNFYSHLEGRKSLFTGPSHGISNPLNNSTLSLTSLNRRQFNASIYGSTSALSDSRLLNTFSPFYKGKTTYGGAAAYNKYSAGAGASAVRITPTLIRPTSSLSTLSSSNNSLAPNNSNIQQIGEGSTISSTAKRILDLINDFATPLSDAKKMANNLKMMPVSTQSKGRLNERELNTSRAMRLSQVRTPYARQSVILQPSGNANGGRGGVIGGPLPPVKELQVPTMSQLLQMKKIQTTTEKVRNITRDTIENNQMSEYSLPVADTAKATAKPLIRGGQQQQTAADQQQKHTNKIKNKVSNTLRTSAASKDLQDEAPPPSINLPTITFPLMQSVPKFDIHFSSVSTTLNASAGGLPTTNAWTYSTSPTNKTAFNTKTISSGTTKNPSKVIDSKLNKPIMLSGESTNINFTFSDPLVVKGVCTPTHNIIPINLNNYKFSPPLEVTCSAMTPRATQTKQPQLRTTGSCLDVFSKPLSLPPTTPITTSTFGDKFKKSASEWECGVCMIRNKSGALKCLACETPRKETPDDETNKVIGSDITNVAPLSSTFGAQFKKSSTEWECDICMIRNKEESAKCVACETSRKGLSSAVASSTTLPSLTNSFGGAFKPKSGAWECPTCMICNKIEVTKCVACETKKPGSTDFSTTVATTSTVTNTFKFGFASPQTSNKQIATDVGFQSIAAQQNVSKWECDACMTRNDAERTMCACCEQPKPGSTSSESSSSTPKTKFSFGATAAAKFRFGFGTASNSAKEEDLRKENAIKTKDDMPTYTNLDIGLSTPASSITNNTMAVAGFQFGVKPNTSATMPESKKDETDSKKRQSLVTSKATVGFKFDVTNNTAKKPETLSSTNLTTPGFAFGNKLAEPSINASSSTNLTTVVTTPSVKLSVTPASSTAPSSGVDRTSGIAATSFSFGSNTASSTTEGFSFGTDEKKSTPAAPADGKKTSDGFAFKTPAAVSSSTTSSMVTPTSGFVFGTTVAKTSMLSTTQTTTSTTTTSSVIAVSTAAVKPMFSFSSTASNIPGPAIVAAAGFGGFGFGSSSPSVATTTAGKTLFGAVTSTSSTTTTTASTNSSTTPASTTNIFGSFGGTTSSTLTFGSSSATASANPANNSTTVSSSTNSAAASAKPTFGSFGGANQAPTNVFGSFGGGSSQSTNQAQNKPIATVLGNVASSSNSANSAAANTNSFLFGSAATNTSAPTVTQTQTCVVTTAAASTSWPKNNFVFGSAITSATTATTQSTNVNKEAPKPTVFGAFGSGTTNTSNQQTTSIFGNPATSSNTLPPPAFGSVGGSSTNTGTNPFAANSTSVASNIFGANHSGNAVTPAPAFGSSPFGGGSASSTSATPTFGSTAITGSATFSGFGGAAVGANKTTNGPDIKKPEPAFNFGSAAPAAQSTSGGFNFGSSASSSAAASKPAFNFGATSASQPAFNFTGSTESQNSAKPFQFGAIPSAPVFNFGGGAIEPTPNAPFQFNAGTAPVSSNIFAPSPTPGTQTAQQAKRKIRAPIRRVTQR